MTTGAYMEMLHEYESSLLRKFLKMIFYMHIIMELSLRCVNYSTLFMNLVNWLLQFNHIIIAVITQYIGLIIDAYFGNSINCTDKFEDF